ncbi:proline dehydrogenase 1, mitochondrial-like [Ruditapes philippinarum]|uniref:proline dehydrogenase 1, mitochondrial-like n=1 Tax=Ruditapes philippinarum TaxID=129788 RepID=UPI00295B48B1|nr:proline dehydrogenase 1, mitochondrial-like [Ruditapes philippinarum]XP_060586852.1 proline dehydrogenase 1, mitochondrial-like [Ruditapes philippinarum]
MALRFLRCKTVYGHTTKFISKRITVYPDKFRLSKSTASADVASDENRTFSTVQTENKRKLDDGHPNIDLSFANPQEAYRSKTTGELLRAYFVFQLCSIPLIVTHNKTLMKWSQSILGTKLFHKLMKATFYGQFVAGEDRIAIRPLVNRNKLFGVKSILDYSAEEDVSSEQATESEMSSCVPENMTDIAQEPDRQKFQAHREFGDRRDKVVSSRTYFYEGEDQCDKNMRIFLESIDGVADATKKTGFCAIKLTALGRPQLLLQMSDVLVSARNFFEKLTSEEGDNFSRGFREDEFLLKLHEMGVKITPEECSRWFSILDVSQDGQVDIMDWDNLLEVNMKLDQLFVIPDPQTGELKPMLHCLADDTEKEMKNMLHRVNEITKYAVERDVRVMVDAEQSYFQPAINRLTMEMMKKFNKEKAIIFNTYQCYLKSAHKAIKLDLDTAVRHNIYFGAKLVRGAYMEQERERAATIGYEDPINPSYEATTAMYNKVLREVMRQIQLQERGRIAVMVASHNEDTVRYTVEKMKEFGVKPADKVICFGQLLGMCDQVSFPLGQGGYSVYKYVPYGPVDEVLPYLSRRAMENKGILKKVKKEKKLLWKEISRRIKSGQLRYDPLKNLPDITPV